MTHESKKVVLNERRLVGSSWPAERQRASLPALALSSPVPLTSPTILFKIIQGGFFNWSARFSVPKWKKMDSQLEILFNEILNVQKILLLRLEINFLVVSY